MFRNQFKIAWRNLTKEKFFTFIKVGGFAIGIAACLLIALFIQDELNYDKHYKNQDQLFRVVLEGEINGEVLKSVHFQLPFAETLQQDFPEIELAGKYNTSELFGAGDKALNIVGQQENHLEEGFVFVDQAMVDLLEIPFLEGNPATAMIEPYSLIVSKAKAAQYFPAGDALGKTVILDNDLENPYKITGIMDEVNANTHFNYPFLMKIADQNRSWVNTNYFTYVKLDKLADVGLVEEKLFDVVENYIIPAQIEQGRDGAFLEVYKTVHFTLQPIGDIYLKSDQKMGDRLKHGDIRFVWLFIAIAGFILLLACINFINLSTAKSANRAKEVGLRKTIGAFRGDLIHQFLIESILYSIISFVIAVFLAWILLPYFNLMAAKDLSIPWTNGFFLTVILVAAVLVGIVAGLYPAFYLSKFKPINVLKGSLAIGGKSKKLRSGLVVFQFATSIVLIISTLIIYQQMDFILTKKLGYDKSQIVVVEGAGVLADKAATFKERLKQLPQIADVTMSDYLPIEGTKRNGNTFVNSDSVGNKERFPAQIWRVDYAYLKTFGIQLKEGRDFSKEMASDSTGIIIHAMMAEKLGLEQPIGKRINNGQDWTVIGVVEDFHFQNLKETITPLVLVLGNSPNLISIKMETAEVAPMLGAIGQLWQEYVPNQVFSYTFLDQNFAQMHEAVSRMGSIFNSFALFAILVACLGLFALSAFMVEQRKKELSIRLVLGAPFKHIYSLLTLDFLKLIFVAILIAIPIGWYAMSRWLEDFAYKIEMGWGIFAIAGILALLIAVVTISYQAIGAVFINPLKSLKND